MVENNSSGLFHTLPPGYQNGGLLFFFFDTTMLICPLRCQARCLANTDGDVPPRSYPTPPTNMGLGGNVDVFPKKQR